MRILMGGLCAILLAAILPQPAVPVAAAAGMCEQLSSLALPGTTITLAQKVAAGAFVPPATGAPGAPGAPGDPVPGWTTTGGLLPGAPHLPANLARRRTALLILTFLALSTLTELLRAFFRAAFRIAPAALI